MRLREASVGWLGSPRVDFVYLGLLAAGMTAMGWRRWADVYVDFGQQLYVPWRLAVGDVLFRDIAYLHGPLSPYLNSLFFRLFGPSYTTLLVANLGIVVATCAVLHQTFRRAANRSTALAVCTVFLTVFAFGQYVGIGNYNWMSPYAHSATHSLLLFVVLAATFPRFDDRGNRSWVVVGFLLGCLGLTRVETAIAAAASVAAYLLLAGIRLGSISQLVRRTASLGAGAVIPPTLAYLMFLWSMRPAQAFGAILTPWQNLLGTDVATTPFFLKGAGLDDLALSLEVTAVSAISALSVLAISLGAALAWRSKDTNPALSLLVASAQLAACVYAVSTIYLGDVGRSLPVLLLIPVAAWGVDAFRESAESPRAHVLFVWAFFGLAMLGKMVLNARIHHYGFYLAFAATVALTAFLVYDVPRRITARGGSGQLFGFTMIVAVAILSARFTMESYGYFSTKHLSIGEGLDRIVTYGPASDGRSTAFAQALEFLRSLPEESTVQVVPEGAMLSYLTRRPMPSRFTNFMPTEIAVFGEQNMLENLSRSSPEYIVITHKDTSEFGVGFFGSDERYGFELMTWVRAGYERVFLAGAEPLRSGVYGIEIVRRISEE